MPAPNIEQQIQEIPLEIVGGNTFGRYNKISIAQTWNMIVSDDGLVDYAGYKNVKDSPSDEPGRGIYSSSRGNVMVAVWGTQVFEIDAALGLTFRGNLGTSSGDVFMAENNNGEISISDGDSIWVYNWFTQANIVQATVPAALTNPGFISFQNGRMIVVNTTDNAWYLSNINYALTYTGAANTTGALQSKPDKCQAALSTPGGGNTLILFGRNVAEQWTDIGNALFPYQRSSNFNIDFGTLNASSIASLDNYIVWLAGNEQSGATVMVLSGNSAQSISTDGINFKLSGLTNPSNCNGFLFRQDGHVIYQFTFPDDNLSYIYDINTKKFFTVSDENSNYHIARNVVFFNNVYYFVSLKGPNLFAFGTNYTNFDYGDGNIQQIPRIRVTPPVRLPSQLPFIIKSVGFTIENGQANNITTIDYTVPDGETLATESFFDIATESGILIADEGDGTTTTLNTYTLTSEAVDLSISRDGGESFGASLRLSMNAVGKRKSRFIYQRLGRANDVSFQFKFIGYGRFVAFEGVIEAYQ
ncbi:MAG: hypothetical protein ACRC1W_12215 [Shewanella sp.]